jgi:hypothetical protein
MRQDGSRPVRQIKRNFKSLARVVTNFIQSLEVREIGSGICFVFVV